MHMGGDSFDDDDRPAKRIKVEAPRDISHDVNDAESPVLSQTLPLPPAAGRGAGAPEADAQRPCPPPRRRFALPLGRRPLTPPELRHIHGRRHPLDQQPQVPSLLLQPLFQHGHAMPSASIAMAAMPPVVADMANPWHGDGSNLFDASWRWPSPSSPVPPSSQMAAPSSASLHVNATHFFPAPLKPFSDAPMSMSSGERFRVSVPALFPLPRWLCIGSVISLLASMPCQYPTHAFYLPLTYRIILSSVNWLLYRTSVSSTPLSCSLSQASYQVCTCRELFTVFIIVQDGLGFHVPFSFPLRGLFVVHISAPHTPSPPSKQQ